MYNWVQEKLCELFDRRVESRESVEDRSVAPKLYPPSAAPTPSSQPSATVAAGETGQKRAGATKEIVKKQKKRWHQLAG